MEESLNKKNNNKKIYGVLDISEIPNGWNIDKAINFYKENGILVVDSFNKPTNGKLNTHLTILEE